MRIITGLPRFTPLGKLKEHAQINSLHDTVVARTVAHGERLKHFKQGREILKLLWRATEGLPNLPEQLPPWEDHMNLAENKPTARKGDSQQQARIAKAHSRMVETWTNPTHIMAAYTDTAAEDSPVPLKTAAVYFPALGSSAANALPMRTSIKGGELAAIHLALKTVLKSQHPLPRELRVFSDSREAIKECQKARSPSRIVREIKKLASRLLQEGTTTKISWVPAHAGIEGNEEAHQLARASLSLLREAADVPPHIHDHGYAPACDQDTAGQTDQVYDPDEERAQIKEHYRTTLREKLPPNADPLPQGFGRRASVLLTKIRTDTTCTPARIASWSKGTRSGTCSRCTMGKKADTHHILWECPRSKEARTKHRPPDSSSLEGWTHPPGSQDNQRRILNGLLDFIYDAKLDIFI
ncbi:uncharacterized protein ISCGN_000258 [Ixodes scapularis]